MKAILFFTILFSCALTYSQNTSINNVITSSSLWPKQNAIDNNLSTIWSSNIRIYNTDMESIQIDFSAQKINYIKLMPRYVSNLACGFPVSFTVKYLNGNNWLSIRSETNFPQVNRNDYIILPFPNTINTTSIKIESTTLGKDNVGNFVFQLAEISTGWETDFETKFSYVGNNSPFKTQGSIEVQNVGSSTFHPNKLKVWHFDSRRPLISAKNIYAPSIVKNVNNPWNIYYGGWDFANNNQDNIYMTTSYDDFVSFGNRALVISNLPYEHANNSSVIKNGPNNWKMLYTSYPHNNKNKPYYGTSSDGLNWDFNHPIIMSNYPQWNETNSDGGNVLFYENGTYHLFFTDYNYPKANFKVHHATSTDFINYNYIGVAQNIDRIATDIKKYTFNSDNYYLLGTHRNNSTIALSLSQNINSFDNPLFSITLSNSPYVKDINISTVGFVSDNNRLFGILYGASSVGTLNDNKVYANWLQKKVIFQNNFVRWGDLEEAYGPNRIELFINTKIETGKFYVYDSDGTTLLYTSPMVTMKSGDIWNFLYNTQINARSAENADFTTTLKNKDDEWSFYPNPSKEIIYFNEEMRNITICEVNGIVIRTSIINSKEINISNLKSGIYVLKMESNKGVLHQTKFIKE